MSKEAKRQRRVRRWAVRELQRSEDSAMGAIIACILAIPAVLVLAVVWWHHP